MSFFFTPTSKKTIKERSLLPIVTADILLETNQNKKIISNIHQITAIAAEHFAILYQELINNFAEFVQLLPTNNEAQLGSLIDEGLLRALFALQQQKDYIEDHQPDPLLTYTLFSAALLFAIGFTTNNRTVIISEKDGTFIKEWIPTKETMQAAGGNYYRIRYAGGISATLSRRITLLLAQQLMPLAGFNWIAQDSTALNTWITLLNNETDKTNNLHLHLDYACKKTLATPPHRTSTNINIITPEETALGEDFLAWLKDGLTTKTISSNTYNSDIHLVENGLFLEIPEIIEKFCTQSPQKPTWQQVFGQLKKIGFINLDTTTEQLVTYTYKNGNNTQPLPFVQQLTMQKQETNKHPTIREFKKKSWEQDTKNKTRHGVETFRPCFLFFLLANYLNLRIENNLVGTEFAEEKIKKKIKLIKKLRRRRKILAKLDKEIKAAMLLQLNLQKEHVDSTNKELKKWLEKLKKLYYQ